MYDEYEHRQRMEAGNQQILSNQNALGQQISDLQRDVQDLDNRMPW